MRKPVSARRQKKVEDPLDVISEVQKNLIQVKDNLDQNELSQITSALQKLSQDVEIFLTEQKTMRNQLAETDSALSKLQKDSSAVVKETRAMKTLNQALGDNIQSLSERVEKLNVLEQMFQEFSATWMKDSKLIKASNKSISDQIQSLLPKFEKLNLLDQLLLEVKQLIVDKKAEHNTLNGIVLKNKHDADANQSILDNILAEIRFIKSVGRDDYKTILSLLLNKKQDKDTERTISFQLGKTLIESKKSLESLMGLPGKLASIVDESKHRKQQKSLETTEVTTIIADTDVAAIAIEKTTTIEKVDSVEKTEVVKKIEIDVNAEINKENPQISYDYIKNLWPTTHKKARFITILDEISENSWSNEFTIYPLNKNQHTKQIEGSSSNAFFIESCWKGNRGTWEYAFTSPGLKHANAQKLLESLSTAQQKKMPIIFWNKEDPMHYDKFLPIAEKCDVIFTTDENKVANYKADLPGKKVFALAFAANPFICNPINRSRYEQETICFAGSYYSVGHDDRKVQMDQLLPALLEFNGAIYDRMSSLNNERYFFPEQYRHLIRDAVDFKTMSVLYKKFKIFLNVNTITDSPTMMSRRVYELLACGTPVISTPSLALEQQFPNIVQVAKNAEEAVQIAKELLSDVWKYRHLSHVGYREVMLKHTYAHRVKDVLSSIDVAYELPKEKVSILMATMREHFIDRIVTNIKRQNYENIELIIVTQNFSEQAIEKLNLALAQLENLEHYIVLEINTDMTLGARLNKAAEHATGAYLAKMDDDDFYFENYLTDMLIPFSYGNFGLVGKKEIFIYLEESDKTVLRYQDQSHRVTDFVAGPTLILTRAAFDKVGGFNDVNKGEDSSIIEKLKKEKIALYASDPFNFVQWRGRNSQNHTWKVEDDFFLNNKAVVFDGFATSKVIV